MLASDQFGYSGVEGWTNPPFYLSSWDTRLEVLGWDTATVAMTISMPKTRLKQLGGRLEQWPATRQYAQETAVRSLIRRILHICEVVRPGKVIVRRVLNQLGLRKVRPGRENIKAPSNPRQGRSMLIQLRPEVCADVAFWRVLIAGALKHGRSTLAAPSYCSYRQPHHRTLLSDASGEALGGFCLETGALWRFHFDQ